MDDAGRRPGGDGATPGPRPRIGEMVWSPEKGAPARTRIGSFCEAMGVPDRRGLDTLARADPGAFWSRAAAWAGLAWLEQPRRAYDPDPEPRGSWFEGGRLDAYQSLLGRWLDAGRGAEVAISWEREDGQRAEISFDALAAEVQRVAGGLSQLGVDAGDRVAVQLPMSAEAVVTFIATASLGAIMVPLYTGFGSSATAKRIHQADATVLVATAGFQRRGRWIEGSAMSGPLLAPVADSLRTIVVGSGSAAAVSSKGHIAWEALDGGGFRPHGLASEHTLLIAYTSGTTGQPKGIALPAAGTLLKTGTDVAWSFDVGPGDRATWVTDPGWIMAPIIIYGTLMAGGALALYDGAPDWPDPGRIWRLVGDHRISMLGLSPTLVRSLMAHPGPAAEAIETLRVLGGSGEPWSPDAFDWLFRRVGRGRIPIINYSGGTEVAGAILTNTTSEPIGNGVFAGPSPGMGADVVDDSGRPVEDAVGELVLSHSSPAMATTFWGDHDRYLETYWTRLPGRWVHGDRVTASSHGAWQIHGRSDDTMKVAGRRVGPAEVEAIVNGHPQIRESAAVSVPDERTGERLVVVAAVHQMPEEASARAALEVAIEDQVIVQLGKPFRPREVVLTPSLPRTRSGKIMRRVVRALACDEADLGDLGALDDPGSIDATREAIASRRNRS